VYHGLDDSLFLIIIEKISLNHSGTVQLISSLFFSVSIFTESKTARKCKEISQAYIIII